MIKEETPINMDSIVEEVRKDLLERSERGIAKYRITLDRTDLSLRDWLQHQYEELLDAACYAKRAIKHIDAQESKSKENNKQE